MKNKILIEKISKKLEWDLVETDKIFNKLLSNALFFQSTLLSRKQYINFLQICCEADNPQLREQGLNKLIMKISDKNLAKSISYLLSDEIVMPTQFMFDLKDKIRDKVVVAELPIFQPDILYYESMVIDDYAMHLESGDTLRFYVAIEEKRERLIYYLIINHIKNSNEHFTEVIYKLIFDCIPYIGFKVFEIPYFNRYIIQVCNLIEDDFQLERIAYALYQRYLNKEKLSEDNYMLIYCLVSELKLRNYGTMLSFVRVSEMTGYKKTTVARRFYEIKKKIMNKMNKRRNEAGSIADEHPVSLKSDHHKGLISAYRLGKRFNDCIKKL